MSPFPKKMRHGGRRKQYRDVDRHICFFFFIVKRKKCYLDRYRFPFDSDCDI